MPTNGQKKIEQWGIERLKPHPKQTQLFSPPPEHEVKELAADMNRNQQLQPVEALPDGTIIAGHKRTAAAKLLKWTEITVWVREDLVGKPEEVEKRLIEDNLNRRQLGPLGIARCYKWLKQLDKKHSGARLRDCEQKELRDRIGKRLDVSGRTLDRYLRVLEHTPQEVQDAVEADTLPMTVAEKVAGLSNQAREQIAAEIRAGADPKKVVRQFIEAAPRCLENATKVAEKLLKALAHGVEDLGNRVQEVRWVTASAETIFSEGKLLLQQLQKRARQLAKDKSPLEELFASVVQEINEVTDDPPGPPESPDKMAGKKTTKRRRPRRK